MWATGDKYFNLGYFAVKNISFILVTWGQSSMGNFTVRAPTRGRMALSTLLFLSINFEQKLSHTFLKCDFFKIYGFFFA